MRNLILVFATCFALTSHAATTKLAQQGVEDDINKELIDSELGPQPDDVPPQAEYPYPGAKEEGINPEDAPKTARAAQAPPQTRPQARGQAPAQAPQEIPQQPATQAGGGKHLEMTTPQPMTSTQGLQRPTKIDKDSGDYYYDTTPTAPATTDRGAAYNPIGVSDEGQYQYSQNLTPPAFSNRPGAEVPIAIKGNGEFKYKTVESSTSGTAGFRFGFFGPPPPALENNSGDHKIAFKDIYLKDQYPVLFFDYELPITRKVGHLGVKLGSGIFVASGTGQFANTDSNRRADDTPLEKYTFFMLPNTLTAQYRFQYSDTQLFVPYIEGGAGYFTFMEFRNDNATPRIGGALTTVAAGGLNILIDGLDRDAIRDLDTEYGINHVFFSLEARAIVGLNKNYDFSSTIFNAGFMMQF